jgi:hypothetical protein
VAVGILRNCPSCDGFKELTACGELHWIVLSEVAELAVLGEGLMTYTMEGGARGIG